MRKGMARCGSDVVRDARRYPRGFNIAARMRVINPTCSSDSTPG